MRWNKACEMPNRSCSRCLAILMLGAFCLAAPIITPASPAKDAATIQTDATVRIGEKDYGDHCASCHGPKLRGGSFGPALSGTDFGKRWANRGNDLLSFITQNMPPAAPGSLPQESYRGLASYIERAAGLTGDLGTPRADDSNINPATPGNHLSATSNQDRKFQQVMADRAALTGKMTPIDTASLAQPSADDWPLWRRTYAGLGYSPLAEIDKSNVHRLQTAWSLSLKAGSNEIEPLVYQGVLFINSGGTVQAIEAATGDVLWEYVRPSGTGIVAVSQPRNMALYGTVLFVPTVDAHLIALDARSGALIWDHEVAPASRKLQLTGGPTVVHGKVIQGVAGCSGVAVPGGCFIVALDAATGLELWRFNTIPRPGEPGGDSWNGAPFEQRFGSSVWITGSYDPDLNLIYFGTGQTYHSNVLLTPLRNPGPSNAALYTDTTLALNADTGKLAWYYQHFTRDVWDLDWAFERSLIRLPDQQGTRKVIATTGKIGILDVLDAGTGQYLFSQDFGLQNLVAQIDPHSGQKIVSAAKQPQPHQQQIVCPFAGGARNWPATAYDPQSHTLYLPLVESCMRYTWDSDASEDNGWALIPRPDGDGNFGRVVAFDMVSKKIRWINRRRAPQSSAILATAGGLVFEGGRDRMFRALDGTSGETLWTTRLDGVPNAYPITFKANGKQYVAVTTGGSPLNAGWRPLTPEIQDPPPATTLVVFALPDEMQSH